MTSSLAVFEAAIRVKSTRDKIWKKAFLHKTQFKRSFKYRIHNLLRRADARGSADIIYRI